MAHRLGGIVVGEGVAVLEMGLPPFQVRLVLLVAWRKALGVESGVGHPRGESHRFSFS
ncbi:MAG: hypothetical protein J7L88_01420 [Thermoplasmata archaeon]|nr:hypothetical protein [Thermoplasmata archaeon]